MGCWAVAVVAVGTCAVAAGTGVSLKVGGGGAKPCVP
jgi:hypothetical protein